MELMFRLTSMDRVRVREALPATQGGPRRGRRFTLAPGSQHCEGLLDMTGLPMSLWLLKCENQPAACAPQPSGSTPSSSEPSQRQVKRTERKHAF